MSVWKKIGEISVDAGLCWLGDPCHILGKWPADCGDSWESFCQRLDERAEGQRNYIQFNHGISPGLGMAVSTGFGDGHYDVLGLEKDIPGMGRRLCEVKIVFIDPEEYQPVSIWE